MWRNKQINEDKTNKMTTGESPKILEFGYFVLIWYQIKVTTTRNPEAELQAFVNFGRTSKCVILESDNIFNKEVNSVFALQIHIIEHNTLTQNQIRIG